MTDQQRRARIAAHTAGALLGMSIVVWSMAWPLIVASKPWWIK